MIVFDSGTSNFATFSYTGVGAGVTFTYPAAGGLIMTTSGANQNTGGTNLLVGCNIRCNTATGVTFQDNSVTSKQMRFDLSGHTASTTRNMKWPDTSGSPVLVGNAAAAAGILGSTDLTAQTASIASTTLLTGGTGTAGMYRISAYLNTTTAGVVTDTVKMTVAWNDGAAQTLDVPFLSSTAIFNNHDLGTLNAHSQGRVAVYVAASQNITFTTTVTKTGTPQYSIRVRIESQ